MTSSMALSLPLWLIDTLTTLLLLLPNSSILVHSICNNNTTTNHHHHHHRHSGLLTNVSKHLYYSSFYPNKNPSIIHDIKLLGSAKLSKHMGSIQIPDPSPTVDHRNQAGRAIYSSPIHLFDPLTQTPASFHTTFSFQFTTTTTTPETDGVLVSGGGCGGLAFVIVPDEFGRPGPWLRIFNNGRDEHYNVFAIEFDASHDLDFGDTNDNHVRIDLRSVFSIKTASASEVGASIDGGSVRRAWITYDGHHRWLEVYLGSDSESLPSKPILSTSLDLSPFLKEYMFVGFTAFTGNKTQIHNILSWNFSSTVQALLRVPSPETCLRNVSLQVSKHSGNSHTKPLSSFMIFLAVMGLCTVVLLNLYCNGKRREDFPAALDTKNRPMPPYKARRFTIQEVHRATRSFSRVEVLGSDSRGVLYRGTLANGYRVAMKRFSAQFLDHRRVLKGINALSRVSHPSLAMIKGWCYDHRETIVVYNYFQNGSLERWLFGLGVLPWNWRFKIIKEIANVLSFLHSEGLVHGNLKMSSVFIDLSYGAILGDYGFMNCDQKKADDVLSFGMLVLEMVSGKKSSSGLLGFAWRLHERGEKVEVLDKRMMGLGQCVLDLEVAVKVLEIGLICSLSESDGRPSMEEVVQFLNTEKPIPKLPHESISYNVQEQS